MGPFLHVAWLHAPGDDARPRAYLDTARRVTERPSAAYTLVAGGAHIQQIAARLARLAPDDDLDVSPTHLVLTDVADLHGALTLHGALGVDAPAAVLTALFAKVAVYPGSATGSADGFADAIQLGTFDLQTAADEWAIADWYEHRRMPAFQAMEGSLRSARLATVCGGLTRAGVFYEFRSMDERNASFEAIEEGDHDPSRPSVAARTIHPRMSPSIGIRLDV